MKNLDRRLLYVMGLIVVLLVLNVWFAYHNIRQMNEDERLVIHTQNVMSALESILSLAKDAETGQRGYIIIGEPTYLEPYNAAVASINERLKLLEQAHPRQPWATGSPPGLENQIANRLDILEERIALRTEKGFDVGLSICERIIKNHGGKISVESEPGKGTIFTISLPLDHRPAQGGDSGSSTQLSVSNDGGTVKRTGWSTSSLQ